MIFIFCVMYIILINFFLFIDVYLRWIIIVYGKKKLFKCVMEI